jgi:hypothetical protein
MLVMSEHNVSATATYCPVIGFAANEFLAFVPCRCLHCLVSVAPDTLILVGFFRKSMSAFSSEAVEGYDAARMPHADWDTMPRYTTAVVIAACRWLSLISSSSSSRSIGTKRSRRSVEAQLLTTIGAPPLHMPVEKGVAEEGAGEWGEAACGVRSSVKVQQDVDVVSATMPDSIGKRRM